MSLHLGTLYHWSPKRCRESILRNGLEIMRPWRSEDRQPDGSEVRFPWVCLGTSPSAAWGMITDPDVEEDGWDLWQVRVAEGDHLAIRSDFAPYVAEVRVHHGLPADRVWWVGERFTYAHESLVAAVSEQQA